jgi:hypothetical protein
MPIIPGHPREPPCLRLLAEASVEGVKRPATCATVLLWAFLAFAAAYGLLLMFLGIALAVRGR